jgi:hypothetical protein
VIGRRGGKTRGLGDKEKREKKIGYGLEGGRIGKRRGKGEGWKEWIGWVW